MLLLGQFILTMGMVFYDKPTASAPVCGRDIGLDGFKGQFKAKSVYDY